MELPDGTEVTVSGEGPFRKLERVINTFISTRWKAPRNR
jgi:hypothetical protein